MTGTANDLLQRLIDAEEPWTAYVALIDLADAPPDSPGASAAYARLQAHPLVARLAASLDAWPVAPLARAYDPKDAIWQLSMLADFGLRRDDPRIAAIADRLFAAQGEDGAFLHGGFDHTKTWDTRPYVCIDHVQTYALVRFGYAGDARVERAYEQISRWQRLDGGWHPNQRNLPGGDRQDEPGCPFGTLNVLRALVAHPEHRSGPEAQRAAHFLLECWERRAEPYRPVGFGIGSTWDKLQYPFVQYQRLKSIDSLSQVPGVTSDARFREMLLELEAKRNADGTWTGEAVNRPYADFDFGQRRSPSLWITLLALRVLKRAQT